MTDIAAAKTVSLANVLLVDDREADIEFTQIVLEEVAGLKWNLHVAKAGEEALAVLRKRERNGDKIDLMLLDINMPEIDGFEVLQSMRGNDFLKDTAVIMCSGSDYDKDRMRAEVLGAVGYLTKPVSFDHLKASVERIPSLRLYCEGKTWELRRVH